MKLNATEKKLVELYRKADADTKKKAMDLLKEEKDSASGDLLSTLLNTALSALSVREMPNADDDKKDEDDK